MSIGDERGWEWLDGCELERGSQEREVSTRHRLLEAEYMLASELVLLDRVFRRVGLHFDPVTFVAVRILEASTDADPLETLSWLLADGVIDRSVALAEEQLR